MGLQGLQRVLGSEAAGQNSVPATPPAPAPAKGNGPPPSAALASHLVHCARLSAPEQAAAAGLRGDHGADAQPDIRTPGAVAAATPPFTPLTGRGAPTEPEGGSAPEQHLQGVL